MKIALGSDIHLEFGRLSLKNEEDARVLILSGDVFVAEDIYRYSLIENTSIDDFFDEVTHEFQDVVYVMGNHEHYHGDFAKTHGIIKNYLSKYKNVHFLEKETVLIDDVLFFGATLWTNMNRSNPEVLFRIRHEMNDYNVVKNSNKPVNFRDEQGKFHTRIGKLTAEDTVEEHNATLETLSNILKWSFSNKIVVVGHHAPSKISVKPKYKFDFIVNSAYSSDLSEFILDHPQIKLWTHGHTHEEYDYMIGSTRVVCNPRGYIGYQECADNFKLKYIEV